MPGVRRDMHRRSWLFLLAFLTACAPSRPAEPQGPTEAELHNVYEQTRQQALSELEAGQLRLKTYGYPVPWRDEYASILLNDYGIVLDDFRTCMPTAEEYEIFRAYEEVMLPVIYKRFGPHALDEANDRARARHHPEQTRRP
jgi:hypothetical protein